MLANTMKTKIWRGIIWNIFYVCPVRNELNKHSLGKEQKNQTRSSVLLMSLFSLIEFA